MKIVDLRSLHNVPITLQLACAINMVPKLRIFKTKSRVRNGFLYIKEGSAEYTFGKQSVLLKKGALIYLPYGSDHVFRASDDIRYIRVDFTALEAQTGETVIFSDRPLPIADATDVRLEELLIQLTEISVKGRAYDRLKINALLFELLDRSASFLRENEEGRGGSLVTRVLDFIADHYTHEITEKHLCASFSVSPSYLRREFKKQMGFTLTEYINRYRVRQAMHVLPRSNQSVLDVALGVGFNDATYFCRVFKKITGTTPHQYRKERFSM